MPCDWTIVITVRPLSEYSKIHSTRIKLKKKWKTYNCFVNMKQYENIYHQKMSMMKTFYLILKSQCYFFVVCRLRRLTTNNFCCKISVISQLVSWNKIEVMYNLLVSLFHWGIQVKFGRRKVTRKRINRNFLFIFNQLIFFEVSN